MKKQTVQINGQKLSLSIREADSVVTLLCLHGWGSKKEVFQNLQNRLPLRSVAVDLPGFGTSPVPKEGYDVSSAAALIDTLAGNLALENVILVGHSFGGQVAANLAARNPDWLSGLVLIGPAVLRKTEERPLAKIAGTVSPLFSLPGLRKIRPKIYDLIGADQPPENQVMRKTMRTILREDQTDALKNTSVPTRLIWGRTDRETPFSQSQKVMRLIAEAELTELPGGHYAAFENLTVTTDALLSFSDQLS